MKTRGAVVLESGTPYQVIEMDLDAPRHGEVLVRMVASGLCHSDDHAATGDLQLGTYPFCGGHEGAGVVEAVGDNTPQFDVGDHVIFSFVPACGRCLWCASGRQNLCDFGATALTGCRPDDPTSFRLHTPDGRPVGQMGALGTFNEYTVVNVASAVKVEKDLPLDVVVLLGCGVGTGWGSAVNQAGVRPGETVVVMGIGGIGINAVQGASHAGAACVIAVDPIEFKRETALKLGATHTFDNMDDAGEFAKSRTNGQGADSAIVTVGVMKGEYIGQAFSLIRKGGTVVVTGLGDMNEVGIPVNLFELSMFEKRIQGTIFGGCNPHFDIPRQIQMYRDGQLKLDELVTTRYRLDDIAQGYVDMHAGVNIRGIIDYS